MRRLKSCLEKWPQALVDGEYHPNCCRFPKSCSADVYSDDTPDELLEELQVKEDTYEPETDYPEEEDAGFAELIVQVSQQFDIDCTTRHEMGAKKYGPGKFLVVDTLQEAMDEVVDLANYARYTYIKLALLQAAIAQQVPEGGPVSSGFIKTRDFTKPGEA